MTDAASRTHDRRVSDGSAGSSGGAATFARAGCAAIAFSVLVVVLTGLLGPSAVQPPLHGPPWQPPYSFTTDPSPYLVVALTAAALISGALGLGLAMYAVRRGWRPPPRHLIAAGAVAALALVLVPPMGSADHLSYAAYGRIAATGHNPYVTAPADLAGEGDPVARAAEPPWEEEASVYGPLATVEQALASLLAGDSVRLTVFYLSLANVAAFLVTGLLLQVLAGGDRDRRLRAALLWSVNPLLLYELVSGAHVDTLGVAFVVGALAALDPSALSTKRGMVAGLLGGAATAVKLPYALVGAGLAWVSRRSLRQFLSILSGAVLVAGTGYAIIGQVFFEQLDRMSSYVSFASPWRLPALLLDELVGKSLSRTIVGLLAIAGALALAALLLRALPAARDQRAEAARVACAFGLGWLLTATYVLPWYDGLGWALLAILAWNRLDWLLLVRTGLLALAYLPARIVGVPEDLSWWTVSVIRGGIMPVLTLGVVVAVVVLAARRGLTEQAYSPSR